MKVARKTKGEQQTMKRNMEFKDGLHEGLPVFCVGIDGGNCTHVENITPECDMAQGPAECGKCGVAFYLVFPRDLAGDRQYNYRGLSGDLPVTCPNCGAKGFVVLNAEDDEEEAVTA